MEKQRFAAFLYSYRSLKHTNKRLDGLEIPLLSQAIVIHGRLTAC